MSDNPNPISDYISYALAAAHREVHTSLTARLRNTVFRSKHGG